MPKSTKPLLFCGIIGPPLFIIAFIIEGANRHDGYDSMKHPVSSLSIGDLGYYQILNFIVTGLLLILFSIGFKRVMRPYKTWAPLMIGLVGMGLVGAGFCVSDPVYGYPVYWEFLVTQFSINGHLHDGFSMFVFICLPVASFKMHRWFKANGEMGWARYSTFTWIAMLAFFFMAGVGFKQAIYFFSVFAGWFQRLSIMTGWIWISLLAYYLYKKSGSNHLV